MGVLTLLCFLFILWVFFFKLIVACKLHLIYVRGYNDSNVLVMLPWLIWITWSSLSTIQEWPLNLITHSLTVIRQRNLTLQAEDSNAWCQQVICWLTPPTGCVFSFILCFKSPLKKRISCRVPFFSIPTNCFGDTGPSNIVTSSLGWQVQGWKLSHIQERALKQTSLFTNGIARKSAFTSPLDGK